MNDQEHKAARLLGYGKHSCVDAENRLKEAISLLEESHPKIAKRLWWNMKKMPNHISVIDSAIDELTGRVRDRPLQLDENDPWREAHNDKG